MDDFFRFSKKLGFWVFLVHPTAVSVLLYASVERCFVSRMRDFWNRCDVFYFPSAWPVPSLVMHSFSMCVNGTQKFIEIFCTISTAIYPGGVDCLF